MGCTLMMICQVGSLEDPQQVPSTFTEYLCVQLGLQFLNAECLEDFGIESCSAPFDNLEVVHSQVSVRTV